MRAPHWEIRGNLHFQAVSSEEEVDWLHTQVLPEEVRLNQILEHNNSRLIRIGAAEKIERAHTVIELYSMLANWAINGHNPSPEKRRLCTQRILATVGPQTQFRVGEDIGNKLQAGKNSPDTSTLYVGMANTVEDGRLSTGEQSIWRKVGSRIVHGSETLGVIPIVLEEASGLALSDEQLSEVCTLVDELRREKTEGHLPHLSDSVDLDHLIISGLSKPVPA